MTAVDGDGIDEDLTQSVSMAMIAAARAGEQFARMNRSGGRRGDWETAVPCEYRRAHLGSLPGAETRDGTPKTPVAGSNSTRHALASRPCHPDYSNQRRRSAGKSES